MNDLLIGTLRNAPVCVSTLFCVIVASDLLVMRTRNSPVVLYFPIRCSAFQRPLQSETRQMRRPAAWPFLMPVFLVSSSLSAGRTA